MPRGRRRKNEKEELKEGMSQRWVQNSYKSSYEDQFGFEIIYGRDFLLQYRGQDIVRTYSLAAAQLISTIMLNDTIMNKKV